jgi:hypothetical protein
MRAGGGIKYHNLPPPHSFLSFPPFAELQGDQMFFVKKIAKMLEKLPKRFEKSPQKSPMRI